MKTFKRILTLLLAFALSLCMTLPVGAAGSATITAGAVTAKAGENAAVELSIENNPGFALLKIEMSYDADKLTFSNAQSNFGMTFTTYQLKNGNINLLWDKSGNATGNGVICVLNFAVKSGATGTANVSLSFQEANNWNYDVLQMNTVNGSVTIGADTGAGAGAGAGAGGGAATPDTVERKITTSAVSGGTVRPNASTAKAGDLVTLTVTPESGRQASGLTVTTASGKTVAVTKKSDTQYVFTMPAEAITVSATFAQAGTGGAAAWPYRDVSQSNWYYGAVACVTNKGLMNGTAKDLFSPNMETTRAMVITILARLDGADVSGGTPWYAKAVDWAMNKGVSDGQNPGANITREQLVTMLYRYAQLKKLNVSESASYASYPDAGSVHDYAADAMKWAVGSGMITGMSNGKLEPRGDSTRAQIATILMRFCEKYGI